MKYANFGSRWHLKFSTRTVLKVAASSMAALFGTWESLRALTSLDDMLDHFHVREQTWLAFEAQVGSPGTDYRLLAALRRWPW